MTDISTDEISYRRWTRGYWRPGQPVKPEWPAWVQDEIAKIQQDRKIILPAETICRILGWKSNQWEVLFYLYAELYPVLLQEPRQGYIQIKPRCNEKTYLFIRAQFIQLDRVHHPEVMPGGLWFQQGFDIDEALADWEVFIPEQPEQVVPDEKETDETEVPYSAASWHLCDTHARA